MLSEIVVFGSDGLATASSCVGGLLIDKLVLRLLPFELIDYTLLFVIIF